MSSFSVVIDACALFPLTLRDTVLRAAEKELFRIHWSSEILDEVEGNLVSSGRTVADKARNLIHIMSEAFPEALVEGYEDLIPVMGNSEEDRHVLAAAVRCKAQSIITMNLRHFPPDSLAKYDVEAQHPDGFLCDLLDLNQELLCQIIQEQAADMKIPPMTPLNLLDSLHKTVPLFSNRIRDLLIG